MSPKSPLYHSNSPWGGEGGGEGCHGKIWSHIHVGCNGAKRQGLHASRHIEHIPTLSIYGYVGEHEVLTSKDPLFVDVKISYRVVLKETINKCSHASILKPYL